jgi:hypothetical protein
MISNQAGGLVIAADCKTLLTIKASDNSIQQNGDNGITVTGDMKNVSLTLTNNAIDKQSNLGSGVLLACDSDNLDIYSSKNSYSENAGTGFIHYAMSLAKNITATFDSDTAVNNTNLTANFGVGFDLEQYADLCLHMKNCNIDDLFIGFEKKIHLKGLIFKPCC